MDPLVLVNQVVSGCILGQKTVLVCGSTWFRGVQEVRPIQFVIPRFMGSRPIADLDQYDIVRRTHSHWV